MALVAKSIPFALTVSLRDGLNRRSVQTFLLQSADHAAALTDTAAILAALGAMTDAAVDGYSILTRYVENAPASPAVTVELANKAQMSVTLDVDDKKASIHVGAPKIAVFTGATGDNANIVDITAGIVTTYIGLFATASEAYVSDGDTIDALTSGRRVFARHTRASQR